MINTIRKWLGLPYYTGEVLDLGKPCNWSDIKVGEVYGVKGCFNIRYKVSESRAIHLDDDWLYRDLRGMERVVGFETYEQVYKLPKKTQELWLVTE